MFASLTSVVAVALLGLAGVSANPAPCDCYVDTHGDYAYINMWKGYPCSGYSLGALYQDRCLYFVYDHNNSPIEKDSQCFGKYYTYFKMRTASGKSKGWVASEYLSCGNSGGPAPALFVKPGTGTEQAPSEGSMEQQPPADNMDDNNQNGNNQV